MGSAAMSLPRYQCINVLSLHVEDRSHVYTLKLKKNWIMCLYLRLLLIKQTFLLLEQEKGKERKVCADEIFWPNSKPVYKLRTDRKQ